MRVPSEWNCIFPPASECADCGAVGDTSNGPVIPMRQAPRVRTYMGAPSLYRRKP